MKLSDPIEKLSGVGPQNAKKLKKLGIFNIQDLLLHFPFRYDDLSEITPIKNLKAGGRYTIRAKIVQKTLRRTYRRQMKIFEILAQDHSGSIVITWFNQPYLNNVLQKNKTYLFSGDVKIYNTLQMQNPIWELLKKETVHVGRIVPVYPLTAGIYPKWLRSLLKTVLDSRPQLSDYLPKEIIKNNQLVSYEQAIKNIHFPRNQKDINQAKKRLAFDELLFYEFKILQHKQRLRQIQAPKIPFQKNSTQEFVNSLPFKLTSSQKKAAWQILQDLEKDRPANRLLTGDVGSGKTVVAAIAVLQTLQAGYSVALMAPTEILAEQHFKTFASLPVIKNYNISLLTGSKKLSNNKEKPDSVNVSPSRPMAAKAQLFIGTHALIQDNVNLGNLGLVIIDEQHRFGVQQRADLIARGLTRINTQTDAEHKLPYEDAVCEIQRESASSRRKSALVPHFLSMTATPIPRSLALTLYGDLDISRITEMPKGRKKIITKLIDPSQRKGIYQEIENQLKLGRQAFVVCPLIDPSDTLGTKSATEEAKRIKKEVFPHRKVGLIHGKLKPKEKDEVIKKFGNGDLDILVSTTVVEVGVNFPNATIMIIEGAERFGLAQLHQLRGRVGRSRYQSYCYLLPENLTEKSRQRLQALTEKHNGLELAEIDLKLRGPGDIYGRLQSGYPEFKIADIFNLELLELARKAAEFILEKINLYHFPALKEKVESAHKEMHLE